MYIKFNNVSAPDKKNNKYILHSTRYRWFYSGFAKNCTVCLRILTPRRGLRAHFWNKSLQCYSSLSKHLLCLNNSSHAVCPSPPQQRWMGRSSLPGLSNGREAKGWEPPIGSPHDRSEADWSVLGHILRGSAKTLHRPRVENAYSALCVNFYRL